MRILFGALISLVSLLAQAGTYVVIAGQGGVPVAASIDMPAEYVGMEINIRSSAKSASARLEEVAHTKNKLLKAVERKEGLEIQWVKTSFSAVEGSSFKFSSSYGSESASRMFILGKIEKSSSLENVVREVISIIASIRPEGDASISTGSSVLGVVNPEQHRERLLVQIKEQIAQTMKSLGGVAETEVSGLEAPVAVFQKNDQEVTLFVPHRIIVRRK